MPISRSSADLSQAGITVLERGWLSSNNTLIQGDGPSTLVDSGYATHADQTVSLVNAALQGRALEQLLNTHLHSDHCGGNAALQRAHASLQTWIPPGQADAVQQWDTVALTYEPTGQACPRFRHDKLLTPGTSVQMGSLQWEIHAAKGHDPHSVVLFQPALGVLISADALWENGFGVVFPELEGDSAFDEVGQTLDLIERLRPATVIPGHGAVFHDLDGALQRARSRLKQFIAQPEKHRRHAHKVLVKFKLLEWQRTHVGTLHDWIMQTSYFVRDLPASLKSDTAATQAWLDTLLTELERAQALRREGDWVVNL
ncbi:MAG: MBL fold metallo-hydrolase [Hydrogenophaga sp.]|uniref:MBL fold metallo-hydrolase n=1 Tax=Hydrogenophaga sp. TaxID=1904254 RepID=UPI003D0B7D39